MTVNYSKISIDDNSSQSNTAFYTLSNFTPIDGNEKTLRYFHLPISLDLLDINPISFINFHSLLKQLLFSNFSSLENLSIHLDLIRHLRYIVDFPRGFDLGTPEFYYFATHDDCILSVVTFCNKKGAVKVFGAVAGESGVKLDYLS